MVDPEVGPAEVDEPVAHRAPDRAVCVHLRPVLIARVHACERMRHRDDEGMARRAAPGAPDATSARGRRFRRSCDRRRPTMPSHWWRSRGRRGRPWWHSTDTSAFAAALRMPAIASGDGSTAIALAPASAKAIEFWLRLTPSSIARLPPLMSPHNRSSRSSGMSRPNRMAVVVTPPSVAHGYPGAMGFTADALRGGTGDRRAGGGIVDHRLARRMLINQVRLGRLAATRCAMPIRS